MIFIYFLITWIKINYQTIKIDMQSLHFKKHNNIKNLFAKCEIKVQTKNTNIPTELKAKVFCDI